MMRQIKLQSEQQQVIIQNINYFCNHYLYFFYSLISRQMLKKAKVVNISFQNQIKSYTKTFSNDLQDPIVGQQPKMNFQTFMNNREITQQINQLLSILKSQSICWNDLLKNAQNLASLSQNLSQKGCLQDNQLEMIFPLQKTQKEETQLFKSFSGQISRSNTIVLPRDQDDQLNQGMLVNERKTIPRLKSSQFNELREFSPQKDKIINFEINDNFYLIPSKYQHILNFILSHFLDYKLSNSGRQKPRGASSLFKRPTSTSKNSQHFKVKQNKTISESQPLTAISRDRTINCKTTTQQESRATDFNDKLQKIMQMQKQLEIKSKRIIYLQNQLVAYSNAIKEKNKEIKQIQQKQIMLKKKTKYQIQRIMKGKVMTDINEAFLSSFNEKNAFQNKIFEINGKKFIKTSDSNFWTKNSFLTATKSSNFSGGNQGQNMLKGSEFQNQAEDSIKKIQFMVLKKKTKSSNMKLQFQEQPEFCNH